MQFRGGRTFRFRQRILDRNGEKVDFTRTITVPENYSTLSEVKRFLTTKRAEFITEQKNYYAQEEQLFKNIIDEYFKHVGESIATAVSTKNEYDTGKRNLSIKTYHTYKNYVPRVKAVLGDLKIKDITPIHIDKFRNILSKPGVRNDGLFVAKEKLLDLIEQSKKSNNQLSKEIPMCRYSLVALRVGKQISLKTANNVADYFHIDFEDAFVENVSEKGLSAKTINNYVAFISSVFEWAKKARYISTNPCEQVEKFKLNQQSRKSIPIPDMNAFLKALNESDDIEFKLQNFILIFCGCRRGEMLGLRFNSFDKEQALITFQEAVLYEKNVGCYLSTLKTSNIRSIKISTNLCKMIEEYRLQKQAWYQSIGIPFDESCLMFTNTTGGLLNPDTFGDKLRKFKKINGFEKTEIKPLKFRHNYATQLLENGISPYNVASDMGHASPTTTFNFYADAIELGNRKNLSQVLENLYS